MRQLGWSQAYVDQIANYYHIFMKLRAKDNEYSPPTDVDKFWHIHILNTAEYYKYCMAHFGKLVEHRTTDAIDQEARARRVKKSESVLGPAPVLIDSRSVRREAIPADPRIRVTGTCQPLKGDHGRIIYDTLLRRDYPVLQPLGAKSNVRLHFSRSSNGDTMQLAIPYQGKVLTVDSGHVLSKWLIDWSNRLGIHEGHLIITQTSANEYNAYFHAMGSNGYC